jgi:hypothetical protein
VFFEALLLKKKAYVFFLLVFSLPSLSLSHTTICQLRRFDKPQPLGLSGKLEQPSVYWKATMTSSLLSNLRNEVQYTNQFQKTWRPSQHPTFDFANHSSLTAAKSESPCNHQPSSSVVVNSVHDRSSTMPTSSAHPTLTPNITTRMEMNENENESENENKIGTNHLKENTTTKLELLNLSNEDTTKYSLLLLLLLLLLPSSSHSISYPFLIHLTTLHYL